MYVLMIIPKTYLMNDNRKEYIYIGKDFPDRLGYYLLKLEQYSFWNLRRDYIYINFNVSNYGYKDVKDKILIF